MLADDTGAGLNSLSHVVFFGGFFVKKITALEGLAEIFEATVDIFATCSIMLVVFSALSIFVTALE